MWLVMLRSTAVLTNTLRLILFIISQSVFLSKYEQSSPYILIATSVEFVWTVFVLERVDTDLLL